MSKPRTREIEDAAGEAAARAVEGTKVPGMNYEEGVQQALDWVLGNGDHPLDE